MPVTLEQLRRFAIARSLFAPTTLKRALKLLGFVQADPIRAPARAQDLTLRHRVKNYRAGDLERRYSKLDIEEDYFVNYGFLTAAVHGLMHPRSGMAPWRLEQTKQAEALLQFVRQHDSVHPRAVDEYFSHGTVRNYWGGTSSATTHLLDALHYRGSLRVVRRENGIRIYAAREFAPEPADGAEREHRLDALVDVLVRKYAPLPRTSLSGLVSRLRYCVPQWREHLRNALVRATQRLSHARVSDIDWYWPAGERLGSAEIRDEVRLLAPFDPVVWDRRRFELFWEWAYRFEAYTPAAKRKLGYYALPLLWRDRVVGWGNVSVKENRLHWAVGYVDARVEGDRFFKRELDAELNRMRAFLAVELES